MLSSWKTGVCFSIALLGGQCDTASSHGPLGQRENLVELVVRGVGSAGGVADALLQNLGLC